MSNGATSGRPPVKQFRVGGVSAAIWERTVEQNGNTNTQYSVRVSKRYLDSRSNEFKNTDYYFPGELPKLILAVEKAFEFVSLKDNGES